MISTSETCPRPNRRTVSLRRAVDRALTQWQAILGLSLASVPSLELLVAPVEYPTLSLGPDEEAYAQE